MSQNSTEQLFIIYQLLQIMSFCFSKGITHGNLTPSNIFLTKNNWIYVNGFSCNTDISSSHNLNETLENKNIEDWVETTMAYKWVNGKFF